MDSQPPALTQVSGEFVLTQGMAPGVNSRSTHALQTPFSVPPWANLDDVAPPRSRDVLIQTEY